MKIAGIVKSSFVDYPGQVACVLFVPLCNYDCFYCHNRPLIHSAPEVMSEQDALDFLKTRMGRLDAVVVTGGEPTLQKDLIPFLTKVKAMGFLLKLDTNGSNPQVVKQVLDLGLCDYYAIDYKAPFRRYPEICGRGTDAKPTLDTIAMLQKAGVNYEVRTTVVPQLSQEDLLTMARELPTLPRFVLNRYRKPETYLPQDEARVNQTPYTLQQIEAFAEAVKAVQPNVTG